MPVSVPEDHSSTACVLMEAITYLLVPTHPHHPPHFPPIHPLKHATHDITVAVKNVAQIPAVLAS